MRVLMDTLTSRRTSYHQSLVKLSDMTFRKKESTFSSVQP
jgi:hypothetical protein